MHLVGTKPDHSQRRVWLAYVALVMMSILDWVYTCLFFLRDHPHISQLFYQQFGPIGIGIVKVFFLAVLGIAISTHFVYPLYRYSFYLFVVAYGLMTAYHTYWFFGFGMG